MKDFEHPLKEEIELTKVLAALGDPIRLKIVIQLSSIKAEMNFADFECAVGKATLSHHLKTLRLAGIITHRREGTRCFLSLRKDVDKMYPGILKAIIKSAGSTSQI
jgi:DNA-binding transcriptional ArsR family regulator